MCIRDSNQARQVLDEAQYNQAYEVMNELHTINSDRYIIAVVYAVKSGGVHTCTSYVAKKLYVIE